ncbi:MAG: hypothetical protein WBD87_17015 [Candidatus Acidiferrales bacterium]
MTPVKSVEEFLKPDPTSMAWGLSSIEDHYELIEGLRLNANVPQPVRDYFDSIITLYLYGWLYYHFYTLTQFLSATAVEMALRERLPKQLDPKTGRDKRGLRLLLRQAKNTGLLRQEDLPEFNLEAVVQGLPLIRNKFAHPDMHTIMMPGMAYSGLQLAVAIINQLWPEGTEKASNTAS